MSFAGVQKRDLLIRVERIDEIVETLSDPACGKYAVLAYVFTVTTLIPLRLNLPIATASPDRDDSHIRQRYMRPRHFSSAVIHRANHVAA